MSTTSASKPNAELAQIEKGPFKLCDVPTVTASRGEIVEWFYWEMAITHNTYLRGMNSIWLNAPKVLPEDVLTFMGYCLVMTQAVTEHHDMEEEVVFPMLGETLSMESNIDEHASFLPSMGAFNAYCGRVQAGIEEYDGAKLREKLMAFGEGLAEHLDHEIPTIAPEKLRLVDKTVLNTMVQGVKKRVKASSPLTVFPFIITHHDYSEVPGWPPVPSPVMWVMRNVVFRWNQSLWKFSPFDLQSNPQTYEGSA